MSQSHNKLSSEEIELYRQIRIQQVKDEFQNLLNNLDNVKIKKLGSTEEEKIINKMEETKKIYEALPQEIQNEVNDEKKYDEIKKIIEENIKQIKEEKLSATQHSHRFYSQDNKYGKDELKDHYDPYSAIHFLSLVKAQNKESILGTVSRHAEKFHPAYNRFNKQAPDVAHAKHPKKIEKVLDLFITNYDKNHYDKTAKQVYDETVLSVLNDYNKQHKKQYTFETFKYEYLLDAKPMFHILKEIEGPDPYLLYLLKRDLSYITDKLIKDPLDGGYVPRIQSEKLDQQLFLKSIKEMYEKENKNTAKVSLNDCKIAVVNHLTIQFTEKSKKPDHVDKINDAHERMKVIFKSKKIHHFLHEMHQAYLKHFRKPSDDTPGDYSATGSDSSPEAPATPVTPIVGKK